MHDLDKEFIAFRVPVFQLKRLLRWSPVLYSSAQCAVISHVRVSANLFYVLRAFVLVYLIHTSSTWILGPTWSQGERVYTSTSKLSAVLLLVALIRVLQLLGSTRGPSGTYVHPTYYLAVAEIKQPPTKVVVRITPPSGHHPCPPPLNRRARGQKKMMGQEPKEKEKPSSHPHHITSFLPCFSKRSNTNCCPRQNLFIRWSENG